MLAGIKLANKKQNSTDPVQTNSVDHDQTVSAAAPGAGI